MIRGADCTGAILTGKPRASGDDPGFLSDLEAIIG